MVKEKIIGVAIQAEEAKHGGGRLVFIYRFLTFFDMGIHGALYRVKNRWSIFILIDLNEEHVLMMEEPYFG